MKDNNTNEIKETIKKLMGFMVETEIEQVELKFTEVPLADGTKLAIDDASSIEVGTPISMFDAEGNLIPAENKDYELADGRIITVVDGVISAIKDKVEAEEAAPAEVETEEMAIVKKEQEFSNRIVKLEEQLAKVVEALTLLQNTNKQTLSKMEEFRTVTATETDIKVPVQLGAKKESKNFDMNELTSITNKLIKNNK